MALNVKLLAEDSEQNALNVKVINPQDFPSGGGGGGDETDPIFTSWKNSTYVTDKETTNDRINTIETELANTPSVRLINDLQDVSVDKQNHGLLYNDKYSEQVLSAPLVEESISATPSGMRGFIDAVGVLTDVEVASGDFYTIPYTKLFNTYGPLLNYTNDELTCNQANLLVDIFLAFGFTVKTEDLPLDVEYGIFKNGLPYKTTIENITKTGNYSNYFEELNNPITTGDVYTFGIKNNSLTSKTFHFGDWDINSMEVSSEGGVILKIPADYLESTVATNDYVEANYAPREYVENLASNVKINDLVDVNIKDDSFNLLVHNPVTHIVESVDMVTENLTSNNIKSNTLVQTLSAGVNTVKFNTTPSEIDGTLFEAVATGIKVTQPTNDISLSGKLTLFPVNVNIAWPLPVNVKLLRGTTVLFEQDATLTSSAGYEFNLTPTTITAGLNDIINIKVTYATNPANPVVNLNGTGFLQLYNSNETAIKFPNAHLQQDEYHDGAISNVTLTSTNQTILTQVMSEACTINPHQISGRMIATRGGGGTDGTVFFTLFKNGVQINEAYQEMMETGDAVTLTPDNIKRFSVSANDTLSIQSRYVGSGTVALSGGTFSIVGKKL